VVVRRVLQKELLMKIGLTYDLRDEVETDASQPDDALEEYDSVETIRAIANVLEAEGHQVSWLGGGRGFLTKVLSQSIDFIFNISEGLGSYRSREAQVPSVLEMLGLPYSGSDPQTLAICLDKPLTKKLVAAAGIVTPRWHEIKNRHDLSQIDWSDFRYPAFIKPACEGSSKGIRFGSRVENANQLTEQASRLLDSYRQPAIVEEYIAGEEITVGVIGNDSPRVVGIMRVRPKQPNDSFVYSLEVKRNWEQMVEYECPAQLPPSTLRAISEASVRIFHVLGCRDFGRVDFRVTAEGEPYFLEINPLPGLNPRSGDLPIIAQKMGWTYPQLIQAVMAAACQRQGIGNSAS